MFRMFCCSVCFAIVGIAAAAATMAGAAAGRASEPAAINPFGPRAAEREDAVPGYVELSDGTIQVGKIFLTRDKNLQILDEKVQRQREVPLRAAKQINCKIKKEWQEKEWKFKETTSDEKMYTGRSYPVREYVHTITLGDGDTIEGALSAIVYVSPGEHAAPGATAGTKNPPEAGTPVRYLLHKRDKGEIGTDLKSLIYVKRIKLGEDAYKEGREKAAKRAANEKASKPRKTEKR